MTIPWKAEWTQPLAKLALSGLIAGASAAGGFWLTMQALKAEVVAVKADVVAIQKVDARQDEQIDGLDQRQRAADIALALSTANTAAILRSITEMREDMRDMRRDLTGRVSR